ncbi:MAG: hypothetical protein AB8B56_09725, partial [Crocinitomicaceae bacterium]
SLFTIFSFPNKIQHFLVGHKKCSKMPFALIFLRSEILSKRGVFGDRFDIHLHAFSNTSSFQFDFFTP